MKAVAPITWLCSFLKTLCFCNLFNHARAAKTLLLPHLISFNDLQLFDMFCFILSLVVSDRCQRKSCSVNTVSFLRPGGILLWNDQHINTKGSLSLGGLWTSQHIISPNLEAPTMMYKVKRTFLSHHTFLSMHLVKTLRWFIGKIFIPHIHKSQGSKLALDPIVFITRHSQNATFHYPSNDLMIACSLWYNIWIKSSSNKRAVVLNRMWPV